MKKYEDIWNQEIEIPEVVRKKADAAFSTIQMERSNTMNKKTVGFRRLIKPMVAVAACAAIIGAVSFGDFILPGKSQNAIVDDEKNNHNPFTLSVQAAAKQVINKDNPVATFTSDTSRAWAIGGSEDGKNNDYCIAMPLICEGEDIKSVSYSVKKGAIQVVNCNGANIITSGEKTQDLNVGMIGPDLKHADITYYKEITLDYNKQMDKNVSINICDEGIDLSPKDGEGLYAEASPEEELEAYRNLLKNVEIICTVCYNDGTTSKEAVEVGAEIMTPEEAGVPTEDFKDNKPMLFVTFRLK